MATLSTLTIHVLQATAPDTVVTVAARDPLGVAGSVALIVLAVAATGLLLLFTRIALEMRALDVAVRRLVGRMEERVDPVMDRALDVAENVDYVGRVVRNDVERLSASVERMTDRLNLASTRMEERIEEFNALMEVVQSEAEDLFLDTAATVRGVREGTRSIRTGRAPHGSPEAPAAPEEPQADAGPGSPEEGPRPDDVEASAATGGDGGPGGAEG